MTCTAPSMTPPAPCWPCTSAPPKICTATPRCSRQLGHRLRPAAGALRRSPQRLRRATTPTGRSRNSCAGPKTRPTSAAMLAEPRHRLHRRRLAPGQGPHRAPLAHPAGSPRQRAALARHRHARGRQRLPARVPRRLTTGASPGPRRAHSPRGGRPRGTCRCSSAAAITRRVGRRQHRARSACADCNCPAGPAPPQLGRPARRAPRTARRPPRRAPRRPRAQPPSQSPRPPSSCGPGAASAPRPGALVPRCRARRRGPLWG